MPFRKSCHMPSRKLILPFILTSGNSIQILAHKKELKEKDRGKPALDNVVKRYIIYRRFVLLDGNFYRRTIQTSFCKSGVLQNAVSPSVLNIFLSCLLHLVNVTVSFSLSYFSSAKSKTTDMNKD